MDGHISISPASFQHTLSDHKSWQLVGARKTNSVREGITLGHFGDVWLHDALMYNLQSYLFLGATLRQILLFSLDLRCKNMASPSIVTIVSSLCNVLYPLLLRYCNIWGLAVGFGGVIRESAI